jgi:hypothetical protein
VCAFVQEFPAVSFSVMIVPNAPFPVESIYTNPQNVQLLTPGTVLVDRKVPAVPFERIELDMAGYVL